MNRENALKLSIKAFELKKAKTETLVYAWEQIKPILEEYMKEKDIQLIKVDLKTKKALIVEPIPHDIKEFWIKEWLEGKLPTEKFNECLGYQFQNTHLDFADFLHEVEVWLEKRGKDKVS